MDVTGQAKTHTITLNSNLTGRLPDDFINETKVFVSGGMHGNAGLLKDNNLNNYEEDEEYDCGNVFGDVDFDNKPTTHTSGIEWVGRYKINKDTGLIYVNSDFCYSCITLVYLGSASATKGGEWLVDELAEPALHAFLTWKYFSGKPSTGTYTEAANRRVWNREKKNAKIRIQNITRSQMQESSRSSVKLQVKN